MANGFGRFFQNLPGQIMGGMPQAPQQPGMGVPSVMGFPAAPGLPAQAPRKGGGWRQNLDLIGSGLREASGESGQLDAYRERMGGGAQEQRRAAFRATLPPDQQQVFDIDPKIWAQYFGKPQEPKERARQMVGPDLYERGDDGKWAIAIDGPDRPESFPIGMMAGPDGNLIFRPGYVEAQEALAGAIGGARRDSIVSRPMPPRKPLGARGSTAPAAVGGIKWD